jgi:hypothetical protein
MRISDIVKEDELGLILPQKGKPPERTRIRATALRDADYRGLKTIVVIFV